MNEHLEVFKKVKVEYDKKTGALYVDDYDTDEQLAIFHVYEEE